MCGFRRPKNLGDLICRSDVRLENPFTYKNRFPFCPHPGRCTHCPRLNKSGYITSSSTGRKFKCMKEVSCRSQNLIYCIECKLCGKQYVGQTKNQLRVRMNNHCSSIRTNADTPVSRHYNMHGHISALNFTVLQLIRSSDKEREQDVRNSCENIWIARLHTITPNGLNIQD